MGIDEGRPANEERYAAKAVNKMRRRKPPLPPARRWSASTHVGRPQDKLSGNTLVASIDPAKHFRAISEIGVDVGGKRRSREIVERCPKPDTGVAIGHKVLKKEEVDVSAKIFEQSKEGRVSREVLSERACRADVVTANAFESEVETVLYFRIRPAGLIDRHPTYLDTGKEDHTPNRITATQGILSIDCRDLRDDVLHPLDARERTENGVTRQQEFSAV